MPALDEEDDNTPPELIERLRKEFKRPIDKIAQERIIGAAKDELQRRNEARHVPAKRMPDGNLVRLDDEERTVAGVIDYLIDNGFCTRVGDQLSDDGYIEGWGDPYFAVPKEGTVADPGDFDPEDDTGAALDRLGDALSRQVDGKSSQSFMRFIPVWMSTDEAERLLRNNHEAEEWDERLDSLVCGALEEETHRTFEEMEAERAARQERCAGCEEKAPTMGTDLYQDCRDYGSDDAEPTEGDC